MTLLEQEGFVRTVPRRGIFIVRKTKREIIEMIEMWAALESMAARLATLNASDADIAKLRHMFDEFVNEAPAEHIHEYSEANIAFHQAIIAAFRLASDGQDDRESVHPRARDSPPDDLAEAIARRARSSITCGSSRRWSARDTELAERLVRQHSLDLAAHVEKYCDFLD